MSKILKKSSGPWKDRAAIAPLNAILALDDSIVTHGTAARLFFLHQIEEIDRYVDIMKGELRRNPTAIEFIGRVADILVRFLKLTNTMRRFLPEAFTHIKDALKDFGEEYFYLVVISLGEFMQDVIQDLSKQLKLLVGPNFDGIFEEIVLGNFGRLVQEIPMLNNDKDAMLKLIMMFRGDIDFSWSGTGSHLPYYLRPFYQKQFVEDTEVPHELQKVFDSLEPQELGTVQPEVELEEVEFPPIVREREPIKQREKVPRLPIREKTERKVEKRMGELKVKKRPMRRKGYKVPEVWRTKGEKAPKFWSDDSQSWSSSESSEDWDTGMSPWFGWVGSNERTIPTLERDFVQVEPMKDESSPLWDMDEGAPEPDAYGGKLLLHRGIFQAMKALVIPDLNLPETPNQHFAELFDDDDALSITRKFAEYDQLLDIYKNEFSSYLPNLSLIRYDLKNAKNHFRINFRGNPLTHELWQRIDKMETRIGRIWNGFHQAAQDYENSIASFRVDVIEHPRDAFNLYLEDLTTRLWRTYDRIWTENGARNLGIDARHLINEIMNYPYLPPLFGAEDIGNLGKVTDKVKGSVLSIKDKKLHGSFVALQQSGKSGDELSNEIKGLKRKMSKMKLEKKERGRINSALNEMIDKFSKSKRLSDENVKLLKVRK